MVAENKNVSILENAILANLGGKQESGSINGKCHR